VWKLNLNLFYQSINPSGRSTQMDRSRVEARETEPVNRLIITSNENKHGRQAHPVHAHLLKALPEAEAGRGELE
jgi:hypothetical protein